MTSLDRQREQARQKSQQRKAKEEMHAKMKELRKLRAAWTSEKSDCIGFAKLMTDFFNFVNSAAGQALERSDEFCKVHDLNAKVMKEVHLLCIQL